MRIAISQYPWHHKPTSKEDWAAFNGGFENVDIDVPTLTEYIRLGHAYAPWMDGWRSQEKWLCAQHISIDYDELPSLDALLDHSLVRLYGGLVYTTMSHKDDSPRARVVFELDRVVNSISEYRDMVSGLLLHFPGADMACKDPARAFMGSYNAQAWTFNQVLPLMELRVLVRQAARPIEQAPVRHQGGRSSIDNLVDAVRNAAPGQRNVALNRSSFLAGKDVARGLIDVGTVQQQLVQAAVDTGLTYQEAMATATAAIRRGSNAAQ